MGKVSEGLWEGGRRHSVYLYFNLRFPFITLDFRIVFSLKTTEALFPVLGVLLGKSSLTHLYKQ